MENAAQVLILSLESRWLLQELEHQWSLGDARARELVKDIYSRRNVSYEEFHPVLQLPSMLPYMLVAAALCRQFEEDQLREAGLVYSESWDIELTSGGVTVATPRAARVVRFVRNALAHMFDSVAPEGWEPVAMGPDPLVLRDAYRGSVLVFRSETGLVKFLDDFLLAALRLSVQAR